MDEKQLTRHAENGVSQGACSVGGKVHPHPDAPCSPTPPRQRPLFPGSDIAAAALGTTFIFGGALNGVMGTAIMMIDDSSWIHPEFGAMAYGAGLMYSVFPWWAVITLIFTPTLCLIRTRTVPGGVIATVLAFTSIVAGIVASLQLLDTGQGFWNALIILPYTGVVAAQYVGPPWVAVTTIAQILLGVILLFNKCVSVLMGSKWVCGNRNERFESLEPR